MRIAVLAPISWRTPPRHYGPWELFCSLLTEGLVEQGHDVTLFASGDSITHARLVAVVPHGWSEEVAGEDRIDPKVAECLHIAAVMERAREFDVIHNSFDFLPLTYSELIETPMVTTIHGFSSPRILPVYQRYNASNTYVAISDADRSPLLTYAATIHHGIDTDAFGTDRRPGDHLVFFGRIHPDKGTAEAIEVARRCGRRLIIAGIVHDDDYFRNRVEPFIDGRTVEYIGPVAAEDRSAVLGGAHAMLHLIGFEEPFGFSVAESLACGTPVIAYRRGSMPELIDHGATGFVVDGLDGAVAAVERAAGLDRQAIRRAAVTRFDRRTMVSRYVDLYRDVVATAPHRRRSATSG
jgi:glycosyltransferase involved in cell wall biosynthesis